MENLNLLFDNRFLKYLRENEDRTYFMGSIMFCMLAEQKWARENLKSTVKHGYAHICNLIARLDELSGHTNDRLFDLGPKYLFILLSSIYCHDLGLVAFYESKFKELEGKEDLDFDEEIQVRRVHSKIIDTALTDMDTSQKVQAFFGSHVMDQARQIVGSEGGNLIQHTLEMIVDNRRKIALICRYHNDPRLDELSVLITTLKERDALVIEDFDKSSIMLCAACLQFVDALDMGQNRVDCQKFSLLLRKLDNRIDRRTGVPFGFDDIQIMEKMFLCYLIDEVRLTRRNGSLDYEFRMSLRESDIEGHSEQIKFCKDAYLNRLRRHEHDCATIIERALDTRIVVIWDEKPVETNDAKIQIGPTFFTWVNRPGFTTVDKMLRKRLAAVKDSVEFAYLKQYSATTRSFYDGVSMGLDANEQLKSNIESYCFKQEDWNIPLEPGFFSLTRLEFPSFPKRKEILAGYRDYRRYIRKTDISYEVYYGLGDGKGNFIGFINLHYRGELSEEKKQSLMEMLDQQLGHLGVELSAFHFREDVKQVTSDLNNWIPLSDSARQQLILLVTNRYNANYDFSRVCAGISIAEIKKFMQIGMITPDDDGRYCVMNLDLLKAVFDATVKQFAISTYLTAEIDVQLPQHRMHLELTIKLTVRSVAFKRYLIEAYTFLNALDNRLVTFDFTVKRYLMPFKVYANAFGGKINARLCQDDEALDIAVYLPTHDAGEIARMGLRIGKP